MALCSKEEEERLCAARYSSVEATEAWLQGSHDA